MAGRLNGKTVFLTGAAQGLGLAIARRFLDEGANIIAFDRDEQALHANLDDSRVLRFVGDVRSVDDYTNAVEAGRSRFSHIDVLLANAGVYDHRQPLMAIEPHNLPAAFNELFSVNVLGYMLAARACAEALAERKGNILFTSSISGQHAGFGGALYIAAKHAVNGLTRQLALELAPNIRVNAIAPGYMPTTIRGLDALAQDTAVKLSDGSGRLLGSLPQLEHYAAAYVYFASDESATTATGTVLQLDGGSALTGPR